MRSTTRCQQARCTRTMHATRLDAANAMPYYRNAASRLGILASPDKPCDRIRSESSVIAPSETATERNQTQVRLTFETASGNIQPRWPRRSQVVSMTWAESAPQYLRETCIRMVKCWDGNWKERGYFETADRGGIQARGILAGKGYRSQFNLCDVLERRV